MSNATAIAATTATLRNLLLEQVPRRDTHLSDLEVTTQPPDVARKGITKAQLNVFLYQTTLNAAWRNLDVPRQVRPGENGAPPLALNLHYLITAYGRGETDNDAVSHRVLGGAMSVLHDHPVLGRDEIAGALPSNDLGEQFERVRVTPLAMSIEELSKLWTVFQSQYRISAAYEATVILIDSRRPVRSALPVLTRGPDDRGVDTVVGRAPLLAEIRPPRAQPAARLGEDVVLVGEQLTTAGATVRLTNLRSGERIELVAVAGAAPNEIVAHLPDTGDDPDALARWAAGFYTAAIVVARPNLPAISSNALAFGLAPRIVIAATNVAGGTLQLVLTAEPRIVPGQRVLLLFGDRQVEPSTLTTPSDHAQPTTVVFDVPAVTAGTYVVRVRIDGVDSIPVTYAGAVPAFDPAQQVTIP